MKDLQKPVANLGKFQDAYVTADGQERASVPLSDPQTLWFNTGTLCNIECSNCYILSSPTNDALVYLTEAEVQSYLDQIAARGWPIREIGFTGGEPFMNPGMIAMTRAALERGFEVLILTNAMRPMMRKPVKAGLLDLRERFGDKLTLRISVDHHSAALHDEERGAGSFARTIEGMEWLRDNGFRMAVVSRTVWGRVKPKPAPVMPRCLPRMALQSTRRTQARQCCFRKWMNGSKFPKSQPRAGAFSTRARKMSCARHHGWWSNAKAQRHPPFSPAPCCPTRRSSNWGQPWPRPNRQCS